MNATELKYSQQLTRLKLGGEIVEWGFEKLRFRLADNAWFKPDFLVIYPDRFEIHEVKGHWREAAKVRIKVAAELFPWYVWKSVQWDRNKGWVYEEF